MNLAHLMFECKHEPYVQNRANILASAKNKIIDCKDIKSQREKTIKCNKIKEWWEEENYEIFKTERKAPEIIIAGGETQIDIILPDQVNHGREIPQITRKRKLDKPTQSWNRVSSILLKRGEETEEEIRLKIQKVNEETKLRKERARKNKSNLNGGEALKEVEAGNSETKKTRMTKTKKPKKASKVNNKLQSKPKGREKNPGRTGSGKNDDHEWQEPPKKKKREARTKIIEITVKIQIRTKCKQEARQKDKKNKGTNLR